MDLIQMEHSWNSQGSVFWVQSYLNTVWLEHNLCTAQTLEWFRVFRLALQTLINPQVWYIAVGNLPNAIPGYRARDAPKPMIAGARLPRYDMCSSSVNTRGWCSKQWAMGFKTAFVRRSIRGANPMLRQRNTFEWRLWAVNYDDQCFLFSRIIG